MELECSICLYQLTEVPEDNNEPCGRRGRADSLLLTRRKLLKKEKLKKVYPEVCCTPCGHLYHRACLLSWLTSSDGRRLRSCPFCRSRISQDKLYPVYLDKNKGQPKEPEQEEECHEASKQSRSCFWYIRRLFISAPLQTTSPVTQLQVAVTINCVSPSSPSSSSSSQPQQPSEQAVSICRECVNHCLLHQHLRSPPSSVAPQGF